jgi:hypothetical protein
LELELLDAAGATAGKDWTELAVYERRSPDVAAWSEDPGVLAFLDAAGIPSDERNGVRINRGLEASTGRTLVLASAGDEGAGVRAIERTGTPWEGDWAQGIHWVGGELRRGTPLLPRLDLTCVDLVPEAVLTGPKLDQVLAGMYVGWIHHAAATAAVLREGVVGTTFPILEAGANDPMAVSLLINLLQSATS